MAGLRRIEGTDELRDVIKQLREAGQKDVINALRRSIRRSAKDAVTDVEQTVRGLSITGVPMPESERRRQGGGARRTAGGGSRAASGRAARLTYDVLRSRGNLARVLSRGIARAGLRDTVARSLTTQVSGGARSASVRIKVDQKKLPEDQRKLPYWMEKGEWKHPVFGNGGAWVRQRSTPNWFAGTLHRHGPDVRAAINTEVSAVLERIRNS